MKLSQTANEDHLETGWQLTPLCPQKTIEMKALTQTSPVPFYKASTQPNVFAKFFDWSKGQERNRFGWLAISLATHGCILTPLVVFAVGMSGNDFTFVDGRYDSDGSNIDCQPYGPAN
jgi:hypothetical protein